MRTGSDRGSMGLGTCALALLLAGIGLHALAFTWRVADRVVVSDAWHFVDLVLHPWATGDFSLGHLFLKRDAFDHSQPLNKLILIANYEWFDLDYRIEALVGALFACASVAVVWVMWRRSRGGPGTTAAEALVLAAFAAVYLSIGATMAYSWPLLTLGFTTHVFLLGLAWLAWRALAAPSAWQYAQLAAGALATCVVADDVGLVAAIAVIFAAGVVVLRGGPLRAAFGVAAATALPVAAYLSAFALLSPQASAGHGLGAALADVMRDPGRWWSLVSIPLTSSVAHRASLAAWFGDAAAFAGTAIAVLALACHAWFWLVALHRRAPMNPLVFAAMVLMLLFYGLLAALWLTRVAEFGIDYLWQPRYIVLYRWNLVALLLMLLAQRMPQTGVAAPAPARGLRRASGAMLAIAVLLLAVQVPLALDAWKQAPYISKYQQREARQVLEMAANRGAPPDACLATLVVCRFPEAQRARVLRFLERQRLNVFDPELGRELGVVPESESR